MTTSVSRLEGAEDTAGAFSVALADDLLQRGAASMAAVAVVDSFTPADAVAAITFTGHEKGLVLTALSTDDAKLIARYLHSTSAGVGTVLLAGRGGESCAAQLSSSEWTGSAFGAIWETDSAFDQVMNAVTSAVDEYAGIVITRPDRGGEKDADNTSDSDGSDTGSGSGGDSGEGGTSGGGSSTTTVIATYGGATTYAVGTAGAASASGKSSAAAAPSEASPAGGAPASGDGSAENAPGSKASVSHDSSQVTSTPASTTIPFMISLGVLCAAAAPVLRRCK